MGAVEFVQPQVVEPVLDHAAVENARLVNAGRARLLTAATAVHWLETPDTWLDGESPAQRLRAGDIDAVRRAVAGMFQE